MSIDRITAKTSAGTYEMKVNLASMSTYSEILCIDDTKRRIGAVLAAQLWYRFYEKMKTIAAALPDSIDRTCKLQMIQWQLDNAATYAKAPLDIVSV